MADSGTHSESKSTVEASTEMMAVESEDLTVTSEEEGHLSTHRLLDTSPLFK